MVAQNGHAANLRLLAPAPHTRPLVGCYFDSLARNLLARQRLNTSAASPAEI